VRRDGEGILWAEDLSILSGKMMMMADAHADVHHNLDTSSFKFHYKIMRERSQNEVRTEGGLHAASMSQTFALGERY
jgi:hypothetical protein